MSRNEHHSFESYPFAEKFIEEVLHIFKKRLADRIESSFNEVVKFRNCFQFSGFKKSENHFRELVDACILNRP